MSMRLADTAELRRRSDPRARARRYRRGSLRAPCARRGPHLRPEPAPRRLRDRHRQAGPAATRYRIPATGHGSLSATPPRHPLRMHRDRPKCNRPDRSNPLARPRRYASPAPVPLRLPAAAWIGHDPRRVAHQCLDDLEEFHYVVDVCGDRDRRRGSQRAPCSSECASEESANLLLGILCVSTKPCTLTLRFSGPAASSPLTTKSSVRLTLFLEAR
jgi:hypothetical protein